METMYYGKKYGLVYSSTSEKEVNIYADILNKIFSDYNYGKKRTTLQKMRNLILIDHVHSDKKTVHKIFVKKPYDMLVRKYNEKKD